MFDKNADSDTCRTWLGSVAERIVSPQSYFSGACAPEATLPDNIILFCRRGGLNASVPAFHNRYVLICNAEGRGDVVLDGTAFRFEEGHAILIQPFQFHHYANIANDRMVWLFTTFDCPDPEPFKPLRNAPVTLSDTGWNEMARIAGTYLRHGPGIGPAGRTILLRLRLLLDEMLTAVQESIAAMPPPDDPFLAEVCAHIHAKLDGPLGVEVIAHALSISESHLRNRVRLASGGGIGRYVRQARLHRSCTLMHTSDATLSEIAASCGFESLYSFSRAFKQAFGEAPSDWRARTTVQTIPEGS